MSTLPRINKNYAATPGKDLVHTVKRESVRMSISWGKSERFKFSGGRPLRHWSPQMIPALYAITYKQDPKNRPKSHTVLFFGQADDLADRAPTYNQDVLDTWTSSGGSADELFIFVHPMPGSTQRHRLNACEQLILEYRPEGNRY